MSGIVRYGSYVPFFRLQRASLGGGKGERAAASYDEDAVSMAVEAARDALRDELRGGSAAPDTLLFATISPPYVEKLNAATIQTALDLPTATCALDLGNSTRAGATLLAVAADLARAGRRVLACAGEVTVGAPGGGREAMGGDGAAAFVFGPDDEAAARVIASASCTEVFLDTWRSPDMRFPKQWEERFGADIHVPAFGELLQRTLKLAGQKPADITRVILDGTNDRAVKAVLRVAGFKPEQTVEDLSASVGRAGAAHAGLMLAHALDQAQPGERILVAVAADGGDALVLEVTDQIARARPQHSVASWIAAKRNDLGYTAYLKWRGVLDFEPPRRPDPQAPAAPPTRRSERWKYAFFGCRCKACGTAQLPPQRVCVACQAVDQREQVPFADAACKVTTFTIDHLAYSLQPPTVVAVVDFDQGGRFTCQLTDVDPGKVGIGDELEMTFRNMYSAGGVQNYFWKARPRR